MDKVTYKCNINVKADCSTFLYRLNNLFQAIEPLHKTAELDPREARLQAKLGWLQGPLGNNKLAVDTFSKALDLTDNTDYAR